MIFLEFNRCVTIVNSILVTVTNHWEFLLVLRSIHARTFPRQNTAVVLHNTC